MPSWSPWLMPKKVLNIRLNSSKTPWINSLFPEESPPPGPSWLLEYVDCVHYVPASPMPLPPESHARKHITSEQNLHSKKTKHINYEQSMFAVLKVSMCAHVIISYIQKHVGIFSTYTVIMNVYTYVHIWHLPVYTCLLCVVIVHV